MRICINCGSTTTYIDKRMIECWFHYKDGYICKKCRCKLIDNPRHDPITTKKFNDIWNKRKLVWMPSGGKQITLKFNPRTHVCKRCGHYGLTHIHHFAKYHEDDPLRDTIELCVGCHDKTKIGMKYKKSR